LTPSPQTFTDNLNMSRYMTIFPQKGKMREEKGRSWIKRVIDEALRIAQNFVL